MNYTLVVELKNGRASKLEIIPKDLSCENKKGRRTKAEIFNFLELL